MYTQFSKPASLQRVLLVAAFMISLSLWSQNVPNTLKLHQSSWQQKVDHQIVAQLDPVQKVLRCEETIQYTNNSPDALKSIYMHIWPNAFSTKRKAYGKEAVIAGNSTFLAAKKDELGALDSLSFTINGVATSFNYVNDEPDVIEVLLPQILKPGETATLHTPFRVKIPFLFSRLGYTGTLFSITQWYPKPAVYDINGWNTFSYQDQGEYYSEFGTYTVDLILPEDYIVGATGVLQNEDEKNWLTELAEKTAEKRDHQKLKKLTYKQDHVSDFAWFADPKFKVGESEVKLPNGHTIHTYALTDGGKHSPAMVLGYIETALKYYSKRVGNYPYDYCTAVIGNLTSAGGMEYPMITICGDGSEGTVIHEVGHNWFQGMLGSQERNHPWMDESINTFYQNEAENKDKKIWKNGDRISPTGAYSAFRAAFDLGVFQGGLMHSEKYQRTNYGTIIYTANPARFAYLQEFLGKTMMDSCMKKYFELWKYKHPLPADLQDVFEQETGKNLNWFFVDLLGGSAPDVQIQSVKKTPTGIKVEIKNNGKYSFPVKLGLTMETETNNQWIMASDTTIIIPSAQRITLNPSANLIESNMANNDARVQGIFKTWGKIKIGLPDLYHRGWNKIWLFPNFFTGNLYDGYTPGFFISNVTFPRRKWEWFAAPSIGIKSKTWVGNASIQRNIWHQKGPLSMTEIYVAGKQYGFAPYSANYYNSYRQLQLGSRFFFKRVKPWVQHSVSLGLTVNRNEGQFLISDLGKYVMSSRDFQNEFVQFGWIRNSYKKHIPITLSALGELGQNFILIPEDFGLPKGDFKYGKILLKAVGQLKYERLKTKGSGLYVQVFLNAMPWQKNLQSTIGNFAPVASGANGGNDYGYRESFIGRNEQVGSGNRWGRVLLSEVPGVRMLKNVTAQNYTTGIGMSSSFIPKIPLKLFADAVLAANKNESQFYWAGGICWQTLFGNKITSEINLPLIYSSNFNDAMAGLKWYEKWNFKVNLSLYQLFPMAREVYQ